MPSRKSLEENEWHEHVPPQPKRHEPHRIVGRLRHLAASLGIPQEQSTSIEDKEDGKGHRHKPV